MTETNYEGKEDDNEEEEIIDVPFGNDDGDRIHHQEPVAKSLHLRWTNLLKSVEIKDDPRNSLHRRYRAIGSRGGSIHSKVTPDAKKTTRVILDRISGEARPGEILATMVCSTKKKKPRFAEYAKYVFS